MFELENKRELERGIRTRDLTRINLKSYPLTKRGCKSEGMEYF